MQAHQYIPLYREPNQEVKKAPEKFKKLSYEMSRYSTVPQLSVDIEIHLALAAQKGDIASRNQLIRTHLKFIHAMTARIAGRYGVMSYLSDLKSVALCAFMRTIEKFDPSTDCRISTLARYHVTGDVIAYINRNCQSVSLRTSSSERVAHSNRKKIKQQFKAKYGRSLSLHLQDLKLVNKDHGIPVGAGLKAGLFPEMYQDVPLQEVDIISQEATPEDDLRLYEVREKLSWAISTLRASFKLPRDHIILDELISGSGTTNAELAKRFLVSQARVGQVQRAMIYKLKLLLKSQGIESLGDIL